VSRIAHRFDELRGGGRTALIPYITAGDPHPDLTVGLMHELVSAGADILELGVPFSDPMADGPVIQKACERALIHGLSLTDVLGMVTEFRRQDPDTPVVLMGYLNPIEAIGYETYARAAAAAGVDGTLTVDMPPDEGHDLEAALDRHQIDSIFLLAPTSTPERIRRITNAARGFVYYVSLKGVTGAANLDVDGVATKLAEIRQFTALPIGVGFGIKDAATAAAVARVADAVVVGSALVRRVGELAATPERIGSEIGAIVAQMRRAMDD
jgi:tryptophan synthase alpha chain